LGNLWLFGGNGFDSTGTESELNDLWEYSHGQWTWMGGSEFANQHGVYGSRGVSASSNTPGARVDPLTWTDAAGAFWLFGGDGYDASSSIVGELNDLWKYTGGHWTWISGATVMNQSGVYGTQGVPAAGNIPGGRFGAVGWIDSSEQLWIFGGVGFDSTTSSKVLNDLWRFDGNQWTWISGSNFGFQNPAYGTKGVPSPANNPGARQSATAWTDPAGNFWLFGGNVSGSTAGNANDVWRYSNGQWTWMAGASVFNQNSTLGSHGVLAPANTPGSRMNAVSWADAQGNLWLFGGWGQASGASGNLNDLWQYRP
jgi:N-acetylneuraminic acid mutarotase